ncbi:hypothetical protein HY994_04660 [Candidatus Micrarchaeota archaeon]|nr:hypothetical protein [Candidatus Micrarchaeota archaeon]
MKEEIRPKTAAEYKLVEAMGHTFAVDARNSVVGVTFNGGLQKTMTAGSFANTKIGNQVHRMFIIHPEEKQRIQQAIELKIEEQEKNKKNRR